MRFPTAGLLVSLVVALMPSCGGSGDKPTDAATTDAPVVLDSAPPDTTPGAPDAETIDSASFPDVAVPDVAVPDVAVVDAIGPDAPQDTCGGVGDSCGICMSPLVCMGGAGGSACLPSRPGCGGFAGALCGASAPVCMYFVSSDYGPCHPFAARDCLCATSPGVVVGCP